MKDPYNSQVLVTTECPSPLLGRDFLSALRVTFNLCENQKQEMFFSGLCIIQGMDSPPQNIPQEIEKLGSENPRDV